MDRLVTPTSQNPPSSATPKAPSTLLGDDVLITNRLAEIPILTDATKYVKASVEDVKQKYPRLAGTPIEIVENVGRKLSDTVRPLVKNVVFDKQNPNSFNRSNIIGSSAKTLNDLAVKNLDILKTEAPHVFQTSDKVMELISSVYAVTLRPFVRFFMYWYTTFMLALKTALGVFNDWSDRIKSLIGRRANSLLNSIDKIFFRNPIAQYTTYFIYKVMDIVLPLNDGIGKGWDSYLHHGSKPKFSAELLWAEEFEDPPPAWMNETKTAPPSTRIHLKIWGQNESRILGPFTNPGFSRKDDNVASNFSNNATNLALPSHSHAAAPLLPHRAPARASAGMPTADTLANRPLVTNTGRVMVVDALLYLVLTLPNRISFVTKRAIRMVDKWSGIPSFTVFTFGRVNNLADGVWENVPKLTAENVKNLVWEYTKFDSEDSFPGSPYYLVTIPSRLFMATERIFVKVVLLADRNAITYLPTFLSMRFHNFLKQIIIFRYHVLTAKGDLPAMLGALHGVIDIFKALLNPPTPANTPPSGSVDISNAVRDDGGHLSAATNDLLEEKATENPELWETDDPKLKGIKGAKEVADLIKMTQEAVATKTDSNKLSTHWEAGTFGGSNDSMLTAAENVLRNIKSTIEKQTAKSSLKSSFTSSGGNKPSASNPKLPVSSNKLSPKPIPINS